MDDKRKRGLGRGLSALMADVSVGPGDDEQAPDRGDVSSLPIESVIPNPDQPRRVFSDDALEELADSIRSKGILQPLIVRPRGDNTYQIVAGERRWRAAQKAQLHMVPVLIRELTDTEVLEVAIIENVQRADLNPVEEARGYRQLMDRFGHTQDAVASALGRSRSHIANTLRLLSLPDDVLGLLGEGKLSAGHARALVTAEKPSELARKIVANGLSVREVERLAKAEKSESRGGGSSTPTGGASTKDADTRMLEADLSAALGLKVSVDHTPGQESGKLSIRYASLAELDDLCRVLNSARMD